MKRQSMTSFANRTAIFANGSSRLRATETILIPIQISHLHHQQTTHEEEQ
jgi:hypothetical protein